MRVTRLVPSRFQACPLFCVYVVREMMNPVTPGTVSFEARLCATAFAEKVDFIRDVQIHSYSSARA